VPLAANLAAEFKSSTPRCTHWLPCSPASFIVKKKVEIKKRLKREKHALFVHRRNAFSICEK
jgi:hypothetical protein